MPSAVEYNSPKTVQLFKRSPQAESLAAIHPPLSFLRLEDVREEFQRQKMPLDLLTSKKVCEVLMIPKGRLQAILDEPGLLPHVTASNGKRLVAPDILDAFIMKLHAAFWLKTR